MNHREIAEKIINREGNCDFMKECELCPLTGPKCRDDKHSLLKATRWIKDNPKEVLLSIESVTHVRGKRFKIVAKVGDEFFIEESVKSDSNIPIVDLLDKLIDKIKDKFSCCKFLMPTETINYETLRIEPYDYLRAKLNGEEQPMTNEQKIKELEKQLACTYENYIKLSTKLQAEVEELKKPKYELCKDGAKTILRNINKYDSFNNDSCVDYYKQSLIIFTALANFAAHNDPTEKDRAWDGQNKHWSIGLEFSKCEIVHSSNHKSVESIYFSTAKVAEAALQMLKDEKLI